MIDLNGLKTNQNIAAETINGPVVILAGAGSGKTRTVTYRIAHILVNLHIDPTSVLAISFTNKAAKEMAERVRHLVGYRYRKGLTISTFHSLGLTILREEIHHLGYAKNFTIYDTSDQMSIVREALKQFRAEKSFDKKTVLSKIGLLKNHGISPTEFPNTAYYDPADPYDQATEYIYRYYQDKLHFYNAVDFDDILFLTVQLFDEKQDIQIFTDGIAKKLERVGVGYLAIGEGGVSTARHPASPCNMFSVHVGEAIAAQDVAKWVDRQHGEAVREQSRDVPGKAKGKGRQGYYVCVA